eukprot:UN10710
MKTEIKLVALFRGENKTIENQTISSCDVFEEGKLQGMGWNVCVALFLPAFMYFLQPYFIIFILHIMHQ